VTCKELEDLLDDYVCGELVVEQCTTIEVHVTGCRNCGVRIETFRHTIRLSRALPKCDRPLSPACEERLRKALEAEFQARAGGEKRAAEA
jgi:hypothetical protein